jgi:surface antigen
LLGKKDAPEVETTGSIRPITSAKAASEMPNESDLMHARAAVGEILTRGGKDASIPWENPATGARGTITPIASDYVEDGMTCRDFLASYVRNGAESWLQGDACRAERGKWQVRSLRPWKSS